MASLGKDDIRHLAALASVAVSDADVAMYSRQLGSILKYVGQLNQIDTVGLKPTSQVTGLSNISRDDDEQSDTINRDELLDQTPQTDGKNIKVPKVI